MKRQGDIIAKEAKKSSVFLPETKLKELSSLFLSDKKHANVLMDILDQLKRPRKVPVVCISTVEHIFVEVLKRRDMKIKDDSSEVEAQYKTWLKECYEEAWDRIAQCLESGLPESRLQAINSLLKLMSSQAKFPFHKGDKNKKNKTSFPVQRLKTILQALAQSADLSDDMLERWSEVANYDDVAANTWLAISDWLVNQTDEELTNAVVRNLLLLLSTMPKPNKKSKIVLCDNPNVLPSDRSVSLAVSAVWAVLSRGQYTGHTRQLLLVVLIGHIMPLMDNAIFLTDYYMDALARPECEINILALQGIFNLVLKHNIEYPDIFGKLYQLFTKKVLKAKYKTRLFVLADEFLLSTHVPLGLVAAFAKRFSRMLLYADPPTSVVLITLINKLLIRHPGLSFLYHKPNGKDVGEDPYLEDELDPIKSRATESQLWELRLMTHHPCERVAKIASTINNDLPSVEAELDPVLELPWGKMIRKDILNLRKKITTMTEKFPDKPSSNTVEKSRQEINTLFCELKKSDFILPSFL